jgi:hypothetical protein
MDVAVDIVAIDVGKSLHWLPHLDADAFALFVDGRVPCPPPTLSLAPPTIAAPFPSSTGAIAEHNFRAFEPRVVAPWNSRPASSLVFRWPRSECGGARARRRYGVMHRTEDDKSWREGVGVHKRLHLRLWTSFPLRMQ